MSTKKRKQGKRKPRWLPRLPPTVNAKQVVIGLLPYILIAWVGDTLRKRLSLLMITAVLLCAAVLVLFLSERMFNENERSSLNIQADQLEQTVKINELLQTSQLAKLEVSNGLIMSIWDEGGPIPFHGGWQPASDRDSLISQAMEQASDYNESLQIKSQSPVS